MNMLRTVLTILTLLTAHAAHAGDTAAKTVLGQNEQLAAGARALRLGDYEEGIRLTLGGLKAENRRLNRGRALSNLCAGYAGVEDHEKALAACNEALTLNDLNWRAYNNRALALLGLNRVHEARRDLDAALALNPDAPKLRQTRAFIDARAPRALLANGT